MSPTALPFQVSSAGVAKLGPGKGIVTGLCDVFSRVRPTCTPIALRRNDHDLAVIHRQIEVVTVLTPIPARIGFGMITPEEVASFLGRVRI